mgnify:CR=1 FL=1
MFDFLFDDIGAKIKNWAKGIFILEALACVIAGIILIKTSKLLLRIAMLFLKQVRKFPNLQKRRIHSLSWFRKKKNPMNCRIYKKVREYHEPISASL